MLPAAHCMCHIPLQYLPDEGANALLAGLLAQRRLEAPQLELFQHSASVVEVDGEAVRGSVGADWLAYLTKFRCGCAGGELWRWAGRSIVAAFTGMGVRVVQQPARLGKRELRSSGSTEFQLHISSPVLPT